METRFPHGFQNGLNSESLVEIQRRDAMDSPTTVLGRMVPSRIKPRAADTTCTSKNANLCEKPVSTDRLTLPIALGVAIPVVAIVVVLLYLHRRNIRKQKQEDREDPNKGLDFGLGQNGACGKKGKGKRKSLFFGAEKEDPRSKRQLSMDMDMSTPYLLPPQLQGSRESLHSLARSFHNEDPYRPVAQYAASDAASIRSGRRMPPADITSIQTGSTSMKSGVTRGGLVKQNSFPRSPPAAHVADPFSKQMSASPSLQLNSPRLPPSPPRANKTPTPPPAPRTLPAEDPFMAASEPAAPQFEAIPYPDNGYSQNYQTEPAFPQIPDVPEKTAERKLSDGERKMSAREHSSPTLNNKPLARSATLESTEQEFPHPEPQQAQVEHVSDYHASSEPAPLQPLHSSPPTQKTALYNSPSQTSVGVHSSPRQMYAEPEQVPVPETVPNSAPAATDADGQYYGGEYYQDGYNQQGYQQDYQQDDQQYQNYAGYDYDQGFPAQRSAEHPYDTNYLGAPQEETKRLSVGFRPLPPSEIMETEDPEYRANRIRSFYKEYFDDKNPRQSMLVPPPIPAHHLQPPQDQQQQPLDQGQQQPHDQHQRQSHDQHPQQPHDYHQDPNYQEQQYYDYNENLAPQPPLHQNTAPNDYHQGGTQYYEDYDSSYTGHDQGAVFDPDTNTFVMPYAQPVHRRAMTPPPRASRFRGGPPPRHPNHRFQGSVGGMSLPGGRGPFRPGSSASGRFGPVRPGSSASGRFNAPRGRPKPRGPPPSALTTLPNPAKLKDDSFALLSAADFAPPDGYKERQRGRSQSPAPEKRPYHLQVPIAKQLSSSYEELGSVPSPHALKDSDTYTGLDFAPPKRFKENGDAMSDAGSIRSYRSNKSGISAVSQAAIRSGAGRVSRLPGDTVFTQAQTSQQLRPSWGMRV